MSKEVIMNQDAEQQKYVELFMEYMREQAEYVNEIRRVKHDMNAHLIMLLHYIENEDYRIAEQYIRKLVYQPALQEYPFVDMGDEAVSAVVHSILARGKERIVLKKTGLLPEHSCVEAMEWCTLFSNLFSNAVEACDRLVYQKREVVLELREEGTDFWIVMENPIEWKLDPNVLGNGTTKESKENHGHGLRNVKQIVGKYNGTLNFDVSKERIRVKILLSNVARNDMV